MKNRKRYLVHLEKKSYFPETEIIELDRRGDMEEFVDRMRKCGFFAVGMVAMDDEEEMRAREERLESVRMARRESEFRRLIGEGRC